MHRTTVLVRVGPAYRPSDRRPDRGTGPPRRGAGPKGGGGGQRPGPTPANSCVAHPHNLAGTRRARAGGAAATTADGPPDVRPDQWTDALHRCSPPGYERPGVHAARAGRAGERCGDPPASGVRGGAAGPRGSPGPPGPAASTTAHRPVRAARHRHDEGHVAVARTRRWRSPGGPRSCAGTGWSSPAPHPAPPQAPPVKGHPDLRRRRHATPHRTVARPAAARAQQAGATGVAEVPVLARGRGRSGRRRGR